MKIKYKNKVTGVTVIEALVVIAIVMIFAAVISDAVNQYNQAQYVQQPVYVDGGYGGGYSGNRVAHVFHGSGSHVRVVNSGKVSKVRTASLLRGKPRFVGGPVVRPVATRPTVTAQTLSNRLANAPVASTPRTPVKSAVSVVVGNNGQITHVNGTPVASLPRPSTPAPAAPVFRPTPTPSPTPVVSSTPRSSSGGGFWASVGRAFSGGGGSSSSSGSSSSYRPSSSSYGSSSSSSYRPSSSSSYSSSSSSRSSSSSSSSSGRR